MYLLGMADNEGRVSRREVDQARAWLDQTRGGERWSMRVLYADPSADEARYWQLQGEAVALWREHRDDPIPPRPLRMVELVQAVAWLGENLERTWARAYLLTTTNSEHEGDIDWLIGHWRPHRDDSTVPAIVTRAIETTAQMREDRLEQAKAWCQAHYPPGHAAWKQRRDLADTLADEWRSDAALLWMWVEQDRPAHAPEPPERLIRRWNPFTRRPRSVTQFDGLRPVKEQGPVRGL